MTTEQLYQCIIQEQKISLGNIVGLAFQQRFWVEYKADLEKEIRERWDICLTVVVDNGTVRPSSGFSGFKYNQLWAYLQTLRYLNRKAKELRRIK